MTVTCYHVTKEIVGSNIVKEYVGYAGMQ